MCRAVVESLGKTLHSLPSVKVVWLDGGCCMAQTGSLASVSLPLGGCLSLRVESRRLQCTALRNLCRFVRHIKSGKHFYYYRKKNVFDHFWGVSVPQSKSNVLHVIVMSNAPFVHPLPADLTTLNKQLVYGSCRNCFSRVFCDFWLLREGYLPIIDRDSFTTPFRNLICWPYRHFQRLSGISTLQSCTDKQLL